MAAKVRIIFSNSAGELDRRELSLPHSPVEDGLGAGRFLTTVGDMLNACPLHDGDSISVEIVEAA